MKELNISAIFSKLFVLLFIKPDFSTMVAVVLVAMVEFIISCIKRGTFLNVVCFFAASVLTVIKLKDFLVNAIYTDSSDVFFSLTLIFALIYSLYAGAKGVNRGFLMVSVFFTVSFLFTILGNMGQISEFEVSISLNKAVKDALTILLFSPEILLFEKGNGRIYIAVSNALLLSGFVVTLAVLGRVAVHDAFPYYTVGTLAKISVFGRLDAVHSALWVLLGYFKGGLLLNACKDYFNSAGNTFKFVHKDDKSSGQSNCAGDWN